MVYEVTSQDLTFEEYQTQCAFAGSSKIDEREKGDDRLPFVLGKKLVKKPFTYRLLPLFDVDISSRYPHLKAKSVSALSEKVFDEALPEEMMEYDVFVRMPPLRDYTIRVKIKSVEKAIPRVVEPEGV